MPYTRIAFATDFSAGAALAFERAKEIAIQSGAEFFLVHILPPFTQPTPLLNDLALADIPIRVKEDVRATATRQLQELYSSQCQDMDKVKTMLLEGDPAKTLAELAENEGIDLLVVGSTGLSGLAKAMFGSVASKVMQKAPCSVLVVRRRDRPVSP